MRKDQIHITGIPGSWRMARATTAAVAASRRMNLVPRKEAVAISISGVGKAEMARLNRRFRGKAGATDVLSFEQVRNSNVGIPSMAPFLFLGDLVLCVPIVKRQARDQRHGVRAEAAVLLVHGLLHLLGFDHERSSREARRMAAAEAKILRRMAVKTRAGLTGREHDNKSSL